MKRHLKATKKVRMLYSHRLVCDLLRRFTKNNLVYHIHPIKCSQTTAFGKQAVTFNKNIR